MRFVVLQADRGVAERVGDVGAHVRFGVQNQAPGQAALVARIARRQVQQLVGVRDIAAVAVNGLVPNVIAL